MCHCHSQMIIIISFSSKNICVIYQLDLVMSSIENNSVILKIIISFSAKNNNVIFSLFFLTCQLKIILSLTAKYKLYHCQLPFTGNTVEELRTVVTQKEAVYHSFLSPCFVVLLRRVMICPGGEVF